MKKIKTEDEQLRDGLGKALVERDQDGDETDDLDLPKDVKATFADYDEPEILRKIAEAEAIGKAQVINFGFWHLGLKEKRKGRFKKSIEKERGKAGYMAVWRAMCRARVFLSMPQIAGNVGRRVIEQIVSLSGDELQLLRAKMIGVSPDVAATITEESLDQLDRELALARSQRAAKRRRKKKERSIEIPDFDQQLDKLVIAANKSLLEISELAIDPKYRDQALQAVRKLSQAWERASYNLSDPEHKRIPRWEMDPVDRALDGISDDEEAVL